MIALGNRRRKVSTLFRASVLLVVMSILASTACQSHTDKLVGSKSSANETAVIGALRTIASAQSLYATTHEGNYGTFAELVQAGNLDVRFSGERPVIGGYMLTMKITPQDSGGAQTASYEVNADPQAGIAAGSTGSRHFYMDSTNGSIRVNAKQAASSSDPTL